METGAGERLKVLCAGCGKSIKVPAAAAGRRAKCPACGEVFVVPGDAGNGGGDSGHAGQPAGDPIAFACDTCGARIKVRPALAGKRVKCPKCTSAATVPATGDEPSSGLDELAALEQAGSAVQTPQAVATAIPCKHCGAPLSPGAKTCIACGQSQRGGGGGGLGVSGELAGAAAGALGGAAMFAGGFVLACVASMVGALIGAGIWFGIAMSTNVEIGYVAWALGGLAGAGMYLVNRRPSAIGGVVAAGVSVVGILVAKGAIFAWVLAPYLADIYEAESPREFVVNAIAANIALDSDELNRLDDSVSEDEWNEAFEAAKDDAIVEAEAEVAEMSDAEIAGRAAEIRAEQEALLGATFISSQFGLMDILFFILAIATAYKVGAGGFAFGGE